jgi:hypothetical protein
MIERRRFASVEPLSAMPVGCLVLPCSMFAFTEPHLCQARLLVLVLYHLSPPFPLSWISG